MKKLNVDIAIIGGGVAGFAAALSAAEEGKQIALIEREAQPGGNAIQSNVGTICGAYYNWKDKTPQRIDHPIIQKVLNAVGNEPVYYQGLWSVPYDVARFHQFIQRELENKKIEIHLSTHLKSVHVENSQIKGVSAKASASDITIEAGAFVDSSGTGILSQLAGLEMLQSKSYQAASQVFRVGNVLSDNEFSLNFAMRKVMVELIHQNKIPKELGSLSAVPGSLQNETVDLKLTLPTEITDSINQNDLDLEGKEYAGLIFEFLKAKIESMKEASIDKIYPHAGIRVLQRSKGKYVLSEKDVLEGRKSPGNVAAIGTWPIEEWDYEGKVHLKPLPENDCYEIPTDCLRSYKLENLFLAGKNISATEKAIGSARVIGTCLQTGYTAGKLASLFIGN